jgi:hypothetical protein
LPMADSRGLWAAAENAERTKKKMDENLMFCRLTLKQEKG